MNNFKPFPRLQELFTHSNVKLTKKYSEAIAGEAKQWFIETFGASFGSTTSCDTKNSITWHYSIGLLTLGFPGFGDYYYQFIIRMIHFEYLKTKEWKEGFKYGKFCSNSDMKVTDKNYRDANPYNWNFWASEGWDSGYLMGLFNYSFLKQLV